MTKTITKDRIELALDRVRRSREPGLNWDEFEALCDLALLAVALKPRPLAELNEPAVALDSGAAFLLLPLGNGKWRTHMFGHEFSGTTTLAIPLSALAGLMESPAHD